MIDTLSSLFSKNDYPSMRKMSEPIGNFEQTLSKYDQGASRNSYQNNIPRENDTINNEEYNSSFSYYDDGTDLGESENVHGEHENNADEKTDAVDAPGEEHTSEDEGTISAENEESSSTEESDTALLTLMLAAGISQSEINKFTEALKGKDAVAIRDSLGAFIDKLKVLSKDPGVSLESQKQFKELSSGFKNILKGTDASLLGKLSEAMKSAQKKQFKFEGPQQSDQLSNKTDKDIQLNNAKFSEMKEVAQGSKSLKFRADVDVRFSQETAKNSQGVQNKVAHLVVDAKFTGGQQSAGDSSKNPGDLSEGSPDFLKKMKSILKSGSNSPQLTEGLGEQSSKLQANQLRPSFMNRATGSRFMQQLVNQVHNMVKANTTLSASVDFKTAEFGNMKLAAEAQGTNLAVKLSNIASSMKLDVISLRSELDAELKSLGFENVDLDFGAESENSQRHAFEEEINKRLGRDQVKLPGDHIADLNAINEWMENFNKVM